MCVHGVTVVCLGFVDYTNHTPTMGYRHLNTQTLLGWKYEEAFEESQKYKVRMRVC